jgi:hypothetical protein
MQKDNVITGKELKKKLSLLEPFREKSWDEKTVKLALLRLNAGKITPSEIMSVNNQLYEAEGVGLTQEQQAKGWDWLKKQHYTPTGKEKESSPYGYREVNIIDEPEELRLKDFYNTSKYQQRPYYVPVYEACGGDSCMEYYVQGGTINITG